MLNGIFVHCDKLLASIVAVRLLKPLGNPPPNSVKYYAASELLEQVQDRAWLAKVTNALNQHWQKKNAAKRNRPANGSPHSLAMSADNAGGVHAAGPACVAARCS
jgi:hypothetical protein